jgi:hypothetical protein
MKLLQIIFFFFLSTVFTLNAQTWFEVGLKGGPATTFLVNKNFMNDTQFNPKLTPTYFFGAKVGINFGEHDGIAIHAGGTKVQQKFNNEYPLALFDERKFTSNLIEIGLLYHRTSNSGYFEVGPRISLVQNGELIDDGGTSQDISDELIGTYYGMDLGFGSYVIGGDRLSLMMGLRFSYGIAPINLDERPIAPIQAQYGDSRSVNIFSAMLCVELNYSLGYLVRSSCGRRTSWISF